jgi:peptidoglycan/xylan/chitin deacetylase (PgdA/CDA1 family)
MARGAELLRELAKWVPPGAVRRFGRPVAMLFHGVEPHIDDPRIQVNHHGADSFHAIARALKAEFQVLPLSAIGDVLKHPERHERTVFLTSDDGYANAALTADILEDLGLPWSLFVSTHHIDTVEPNPLTLARLFFYYAPSGRYVIPNFAQPFELGSADERAMAARRSLGALKRLDMPRAQQSVDAMCAALIPGGMGELLSRFLSEKFLNWTELAALHKRGVEIGAHAHFHWPMHSGQAPEYFVEQATLSRARIEAEIGPCRFFAYPFGHVGDVAPGAWRAVRDAGFDFAFTTLAGSLDGGVNPWLLPRYGLAPHDAHLDSLLPMLRVANSRLTRWQKGLAA